MKLQDLLKKNRRNRKDGDEFSSPGPDFREPASPASEAGDFPAPDPGLEWNENTGAAGPAPSGQAGATRFRLMALIAAALIAVAATTDAMGRDFLREDPFADPSHYASHEVMDPTASEPTIPGTEVPLTEIPETDPSETFAPETTEEPATEDPTTEEPTTEAPTTEAPTTAAPTTEAPTTEAPTTEPVYDDEFPVLINPWPNGYSSANWTNTYEYPNDYLENPVDDNKNIYLEPGCEYLIMGNEEEGTLPIHVGVDRTQEFPDIVDLTDRGAHYDADTNTLTLTDFDGGDLALEANLMGNNFTIELHGENRLSRIRIWGWYFGGSLTITGDGSLAVNDTQTSGVGLYMESEFSPSCLMIDRDVTVDIYGSPDIENSAALYIYATTFEGGIYALQPQQMEGGTLTVLQQAELSYGTTYVYGVMTDEEGTVHSLHVKFSPAP
ncbi:MAG: hypothetical protein J5493_03215 [Lachnospiraceae bacterium]|nr:hypothetical protein [Lachnospiraceae bacterium]